MPCREIWILICSVCLSPSRSETESFVEQLSARSRHRRRVSPEEAVTHQPARVLQEPRPKTRGLSDEQTVAPLGGISKSVLQDRFRLMSLQSCYVQHAHRLLLMMKRAFARSDAEQIGHRPRYLEVTTRLATPLLSAELPRRSQAGGSSGRIDRATSMASRWRRVFAT